MDASDVLSSTFSTHLRRSSARLCVSTTIAMRRSTAVTGQAATALSRLD